MSKQERARRSCPSEKGIELTDAMLVRTNSPQSPRQGSAQNARHDAAHHSTAWQRLREEVVGGFLYSHARARANTSQAFEIASFCYALIELLSEKGLITLEELDGRKTVVAERLLKKFAERGIGAFRQVPEYDKYDFDKEVHIDCQSRVHLCEAACCRLFSFALSKQDIEEGIVQWELGQPYMIAKSEDGYCAHLDRARYRCTVHNHRPVPCRAFDCRHDERIWLDFENKVISPNLRASLEISTDSIPRLSDLRADSPNERNG
jgi:Fe-S-cluster containining protein